MGVSGQLISNIERGVALPPLNSFSRLLEVYRADRERVISFMAKEFERSMLLRLE